MFSAAGRRITSARFSHSEIRGSMAIQRLTAAYRSRSRPSSTLGAKASTMCPYYLDGDLGYEAARPRPVIPVSLATVWFSRSVERQAVPRAPAGDQASALRPRRARRSLKTQQHAPRPRLRPAKGPAPARRPGPVDMSSARLRSEGSAGRRARRSGRGLPAAEALAGRAP